MLENHFQAIRIYTFSGHKLTLFFGERSDGKRGVLLHTHVVGVDVRAFLTTVDPLSI